MDQRVLCPSFKRNLSWFRTIFEDRDLSVHLESFESLEHVWLQRSIKLMADVSVEIVD